MKNQMLTLKQLDRQLHVWKLAHDKFDRPRVGWVKMLRNTLGMTAQQLGERLGVARSRVVQLENAEKNNAITLGTLQHAADAMGFEMVYAFIPKKPAQSIEDILKAKATEIAETTVANVSHSMALEKQATGKPQQKEQKEALIKNLLEGSFKKLWRKK